MKVLIVGAGIAGLSAAILLEKKGIEVKLIEKSHEPSNLGFTMLLYPNSTPLLKELGVFEDIKKESKIFEKYETYDSKGRFIFHLDFTRFYKEGESESLLIKRKTLYSSLLSKYGKENILFNSEVRDIQDTEDKVTVTYLDGHQESFDFVIGADGINSSMRSHFFSDDDVRSYHLYLWIHWLDKEFEIPPTVRQYEGKNAGMMMMPIDNENCAIYTVILNSSTENELIDEDFFERAFVGFAEPLPSIVKTLRKAEYIYKTPIKHIETKEFYRGRVVLIGDAIHAMSPLTALGSTLGMQDAYVLAEELSKDFSNYKVALESFQQRRLKIINKAKFITNSAMGVASKLASNSLYKFMYPLGKISAPITKTLLQKALADFIYSKI